MSEVHYHITACHILSGGGLVFGFIVGHLEMATLSVFQCNGYIALVTILF